jgi:hypothetical protein
MERRPDAYHDSWSEAFDQWRKQKDSRRQLISKILIEQGATLVRRRALENEIIPVLRELALASDTELKPLVAALATHRRWRWRGLSRGAAKALREIEKLLVGDELSSQIKRYVILGCWDDYDRGKGGKYGEQHARLLRRLSRLAILHPTVLIDLLPQLCSEQGFSLDGFGFWVGKIDRLLLLWPQIWRTHEDAGEARNGEFTGGYMSAIFSRNPREWESRVTEILKHKSGGPMVGRLVLASGVTEPILNLLCVSVEADELPDETFEHFDFARRRGTITLDRTIEFVNWCVRLNRPKLVQNALSTAHIMFCFDKQAALMPDQAVFALLTSEQAFHQNDRSHYNWGELAAEYIKKYPNQSVAILENLIPRLADHSFLLDLSRSYAQTTLLNVIKVDPHAAWKVISQHLESPSSNLTWHVAHWLGTGYIFSDEAIAGPLALFDPTDVLAWVAVDPENRARLIARECPKAFDPTNGTLTREMMKLYGHREDVRGALSANFGSGGFMGKASDYYRTKREKMRGWLGQEREAHIIAWLETTIEYLNEDVRRSEIQEEREF